MPGADGDARHDLVVIGASAGGVEALRELIACLPPDFSAPIVVVLHLPAGGTSVLPSILDRVGPLQALPAANGEQLRPGTIYVAVPDCHVQIDDGRLRVVGGPRENGHRPAIDPLFRTAALSHGEHAIGVILSGALDDGTRGLRAIKAHGGLTIVQDPQTALHPGMPTAAIRFVAPDRVLTVPEIGATLARFVNSSRKKGHNGVEMNVRSERAKIHEQADPDQPGEETGLTCPECGGAIYELADGVITSYRCRVGHVYGSDTFVVEQSKTVENSLWAALRLLEERAVLMRRLAEQHGSFERSARNFSEKADELEEHAADLTRLLRDVTAASQPAPVEDE